MKAMRTAMAGLAVLAGLAACGSRAGSMASPGTGWTKLAELPAPSARAAVLMLVSREAGSGDGVTRCLAYAHDVPASAADLAFVRTRIPAVQPLARCRWVEDSHFVDSVSGGPALVIMAFPKRHEGAGEVFDGSTMTGNMGVNGREYRATRTAKGWLVEQNGVMFMS